MKNEKQKPYTIPFNISFDLFLKCKAESITDAIQYVNDILNFNLKKPKRESLPSALALITNSDFENVNFSLDAQKAKKINMNTSFEFDNYGILVHSATKIPVKLSDIDSDDIQQIEEQFNAFCGLVDYYETPTEKKTITVFKRK